MLREVARMKESVTYQAILREGMTNEARKLLLLQGRARFGEPSKKVEEALNALSDLDQLEEPLFRVLQVSSLEELLGLSGSPHHRGDGGLLLDRGRERAVTLPLPPNRTGGFPASGSPVGDLNRYGPVRDWKRPS
jgi:hypothetical protein